MKKGTTSTATPFQDKVSNYSIIIIESKGKEHFCLVDNEDFNLVNNFHWNISNNGYAITTIHGKSILMHRLIMGVTDPAFQVDHKQHNKLDNRKEKLRVCTASENRRNSLKHMAASSKLKGIYDDGGKWHVQIFVNGKVRNLGLFYSEITAAKLYDKVAKKHFKEFACLNFPEFNYDEQLVIPGFL